MSWLMAPHDPEWAAQYEDEASRLREVFGRELVAIHHVGSTAIPGIKAKPIIDIVIVIEDIRRIHAFHEAMIALGYRPRGEGKDPFRTPGRFYFNKPHCNIHTHHAHVMQAGHLDIEAKLNFRDYLRAHPEEARAYSDLKARLTAENTQGIGEYMEGKDAFVKGIIARAKQWKAQEPQRS
ncbi:hypothetical protein CMK11_06785 [Candidatus Poribacteria bacterium]|nr:hypothetical protein [Candidatus Poribacteria bacterium]